MMAVLIGLVAFLLGLIGISSQFGPPYTPMRATEMLLCDLAWAAVCAAGTAVMMS